MTDDWGAGRGPSEPRGEDGPRPRHVQREPFDDLVPDIPDKEPRPPTDPVAVAAVAAGMLGIVVFGILLALVTAILGSIAGQRAREAGRSLELPYIAFVLAGVDGIVWLALHYLFDIPYPIG